MASDPNKDPWYSSPFKDVYGHLNPRACPFPEIRRDVKETEEQERISAQARAEQVWQPADESGHQTPETCLLPKNLIEDTEIEEIADSGHYLTEKEHLYARRRQYARERQRRGLQDLVGSALGHWLTERERQKETIMDDQINLAKQKILAAFEDAARNLEPEQVQELADAVAAFTRAAAAPEKTTPPATAETPDLSHIPQWVSREESGPASAYLKTHFKDYLKSENPALDRDLICLRDLQAQHKPLWQGLYNESKMTGIKPSAYLASKPQRTKEAAQGAVKSSALAEERGKVREGTRGYNRLKYAINKYASETETLETNPS